MPTYWLPKKNFQPAFFVFSCAFYVFNCIQASYAGLFDAKKKEPFGGGEPRQDHADGQKSIRISVGGPPTDR
ncbi:hypothetical protein [Pedobacter jeongneungensis]|uniref:hypothetical protein n=1 Tax=Pedobacter jeongneungensis TaxID=947309 RepID=UPI0031DCD343